LAGRAAERLTAAGMRVVNRGDPRAAIRLLQPGVALLPPENRRADELRLEIAGALAETGRFEDSLAMLSDLEADSRERGDLVLEARAELQALDLSFDRGLRDKASLTARLDRASQLAERSGDDRALSRYWGIVGTIALNYDDDYEASVEALDRAFEHATRAGVKRDLYVIGLNRAILALSGTPHLDTALSALQAMLELPDLPLVMRSEVLQRVGLVKAMTGDSPGGRSDVTEARRIFVDLGVILGQPENLRTTAWIARLDGNYAEEVEIIDQILAIVSDPASPSSWDEAAASAQQALALAKLGRLEAARSAIERSEIEPAVRIARYRAVAMARVLAEEGHREEALTAAGNLETDADDSPFPNSRAETYLESGVVAQIAGDRKAAERRAMAAIEVAARKGIVAVELKARALLSGDISRL
jgi:tetratricopeptide (TPR) repeat protein